MSIIQYLQNTHSEHSQADLFKTEWTLTLQESLPLYSKLPEALRDLLHQKLTHFIRTTTFQSCEGLILTDQIILTVSAQACLLILKQEGDPYANLHTIKLFPSAFSSTIETIDANGDLTETIVLCEGESWEDGTVLLAWDSVHGGARNICDGENVTLHEFAHQLDALDGDTDGVPRLPNQEAFHVWATVFGEHCSDFLEKIMNNQKTVIDSYAATSPGEFFAVATETFFEKPKALKAKRPSLYAELSKFYQLDPVSWL